MSNKNYFFSLNIIVVELSFLLKIPYNIWEDNLKEFSTLLHRGY